MSPLNTQPHISTLATTPHDIQVQPHLPANPPPSISLSASTLPLMKSSVNSEGYGSGTDSQYIMNPYQFAPIPLYHHHDYCDDGYQQHHQNQQQHDQLVAKSQVQPSVKQSRPPLRRNTSDPNISRYMPKSSFKLLEKRSKLLSSSSIL